MTFDTHTACEAGHSPSYLQEAETGTPPPMRSAQRKFHTRHALTKLLRAHGIAPTRQRIEIARTLFEGDQHLSADQILSAMNQRHFRTSKATVYNTLKLFLGKRLVRELIIDPTRVYYDRNTEPHHHFYDIETGTLTDIHAGSIHINDLPALPAGFVVEDIDIIIRTRRIR